MMPQVNRRHALAMLLAGLALPGCGAPAEARPFRVQLSEADWRRRLSPTAFVVLRQEGTERAYTSPLNREKRAGTYHCAGCARALFASRTKYESSTGWPSFWQALPNAVGTATDFRIGLPRTEVHCADCGGHLGHLFTDGPRPTGKRYCMNGVALQFRAA